MFRAACPTVPETLRSFAVGDDPDSEVISNDRSRANVVPDCTDISQ